jgi:hypothetical protein
MLHEGCRRFHVLVSLDVLFDEIIPAITQIYSGEFSCTLRLRIDFDDSSDSKTQIILEEGARKDQFGHLEEDQIQRDAWV